MKIFSTLTLSQIMLDELATPMFTDLLLFAIFHGYPCPRYSCYYQKNPRLLASEPFMHLRLKFKVILKENASIF